MILALIIWGAAFAFLFLGCAFVLPAQGYSGGMKVGPKVAFWLFVVFEFVAVALFILPFKLLE